MVGLSAAGKQALDKVFAQASQDPLLPSFVFGATTVDGEIYFEGHGPRVPSDPSSDQVGPESVFWLCSQSKLITNIAGLQLIERGKLSLEDPVADYIPELKDPVVVDNIMSPKPNFVPAKEIMRIKHLLDFSSGLYYTVIDQKPDRTRVEYSSPHDKEDPVGEFFRFLKRDYPGVPLKFEPGTDWAYGWSSDVLGFIIEKISGLTLEQYLKENIFDPLGMKATFFLTPELAAKKVGYWFRREGKLEPHDTSIRLYETDPSKVHRHLGGVALYASARDYLTFLRHILQVQTGTAAKPILGKEYIATVFQPSVSEKGQKSLEFLYTNFMSHAHAEGQHWGNGLAVSTKDWPGRRKAGSAMWGGWANTNHLIDPTTGIALVFQTQTIPLLDKEVMRYLEEFETTLYSGLE